ncbi:MAG: recombinase family protein [Candidatus Andersenbacteria bacterium]|nr:recombinase family protein [Candidatus Andersenbacteria bacterium]MBI3251187.1 recombinase family protein [Candidatus Andersenbacteria bacterium]
MTDLNLKERKVALYIRSASGQQSDKKNDQQEQQLQAYVRRSGGNGSISYKDIGSGSNADRPALKRLLDDAREGKVDRVLVIDSSRLARSVIKQFLIGLELEKAGAELIAIQQRVHCPHCGQLRNVQK